MGKNTFKIKSSKTKGKTLFSYVEEALKLDSFFDGGIPTQFVPKILFLMFLGIFHVANSHYADKSIRKIDNLEQEVEDLRADYTTMKYEYMYGSIQSEVLKKVKGMGLEEQSEPPYKIEIVKGEY